jgi:hypothetical protein
LGVVTEESDDFKRLWRSMEPAEELVRCVSGIVNKHVNSTYILDLLSRVAEVDAMAELVHSLEERRGRGCTRSGATARALPGADNRRSGGVLIRGVSDAMSSFDTMDDVVKGLFPHRQWAVGGAHDGKAEKCKGHDNTVKASRGVALKLSERGLGKKG